MSKFEGAPNHFDARLQGGVTVRDVEIVALYLSLATIFLWVGGMKFTAYEAKAITPFVINSPLTSWMHPAFGAQGTSYVIGVFELITGLLVLGKFVRQACR